MITENWTSNVNWHFTRWKWNSSRTFHLQFFILHQVAFCLDLVFIPSKKLAGSTAARQAHQQALIERICIPWRLIESHLHWISSRTGSDSFLGPDIASKISQFLQEKNYPINKVMTAFNMVLIWQVLQVQILHWVALKNQFLHAWIEVSLLQTQYWESKSDISNPGLSSGVFPSWGRVRHTEWGMDIPRFL